jgi:hypothetical protein
MSTLYDVITPRLQEFIERQKIFFVGTAPLSADGHVNLSPKGYDTLRVLGPRCLGYLDLTGSGIETIAHVRENRRMVIMFCAFEGAPRILRLHGKARVLAVGEPEFDALIDQFPRLPGTRGILVLDVQRIHGSCGFSIPYYEYRGERDQLLRWTHQKGPEWIGQYQREHNSHSIDGLPGLPRAKVVE